MAFCFTSAFGPATKAAGSSRTRSPSDTLALLVPAPERFGITRLANITGLDVIGYPVWQAIRPNARSLSVSQGKGPEALSAKISALMESLEAHHAEHARCPLRLESQRVLAREDKVADPLLLPLASTRHFHDDIVLPWALGADLVLGDPLWVPFELVTSNFTVPRVAGSGYFRASSNGMGAGNHPAEAALQGICELVERDAEALFRLGGDEAKQRARVDATTIDDPEARALLELLEQAGLETMIWDMTSDIRLPCFSVVIFDLASDPELHPRPAAEGSGCHFDRGAALCRALGEAMQSRLTSIAGSRDDLTAARYDAFQSEASLRHWREQVALPASQSFHSAPTAAPTPSVDDDLAIVVDRLRERGLEQIAFVDLSSPNLDLAFARMVIPGLEGSSASPTYVPGPRARARITP